MYTHMYMQVLQLWLIMTGRETQFAALIACSIALSTAARIYCSKSLQPLQTILQDSLQPSCSLQKWAEKAGWACWLIELCRNTFQSLRNETAVRRRRYAQHIFFLSQPKRSMLFGEAGTESDAQNP